jgi:hypothetical protein
MVCQLSRTGFIAYTGSTKVACRSHLLQRSRTFIIALEGALHPASAAADIAITGSKAQPDTLVALMAEPPPFPRHSSEMRGHSSITSATAVMLPTSQFHENGDRCPPR